MTKSEALTSDFVDSLRGDSHLLFFISFSLSMSKSSVTIHSFAKRKCRQRLTAGSTEFLKGIRFILSQAEQCLEFVHAVSGAGFDICSDIGKILRIIHA